MKVRKRSGGLEEVNLDKITRALSFVSEGLEDVDPYKIATKTVGGLYDGVHTTELDLLSIQTSVGFIAENPEYSRVAARLLSRYIDKEVSGQDVESFSQSIDSCHQHGLVSDRVREFVQTNKRKLNHAVKPERNDLFEYYGIRTVYDRYLLKHPTSRLVLETPQYFFLRVSCGLADTVEEAVELYNLLSSLEYMTSTPTLFNSGTRHSQMSSCYLLDSPQDNLEDIEKRHADIAQLSKWAGGIGLSYSRIRPNGSLIKGTNGKSNGIVPFLHSLSSNIAAVNQGGKRRGSACVYLDTWHPDILDFLELRDNTGDREKRAYNLNLANWIPDIFMQRVKTDGVWSLFDPSHHPELMDLFGAEFDAQYQQLEEEKRYVKQIPARKVYARMMRTLAETGNGWMTWKDTANLRGNSAVQGHIVRSSNLCLSPDTLIRCKINGEELDVAIKLLSEKFKMGDEVLVYSFDEKNEEFIWTPIANAGLTSQESEVVTVDFDGITIECTEDHLLLTQRGWIKASELMENDDLIAPDLSPVHRLEMWNLTKYMHEKTTRDNTLQVLQDT